MPKSFQFLKLTACQQFISLFTQHSLFERQISVCLKQILAYHWRLAVIIKRYVYVCVDLNCFSRKKKTARPVLPGQGKLCCNRSAHQEHGDLNVWKERSTTCKPETGSHIYPCTRVIKRTTY